MAIIIAVIVVTVIGIICAVVLAVASKVMAVEVDERVTQLTEALPGANCGGCGFPGCSGYAAALVEDPDLSLTLCAAGGNACAQAMAAILGKEAGEMVAQVAVVHCKGDCKYTENKTDYQGMSSCAAAKLMYGGPGSCIHGCLGLGDCANVCTNDAICIENGIAHVNTRLCSGCGACVKACPNGVISVKPADAPVYVTCSNKEKGPLAMKHCKVSCIGCKLCEKNCPNEAIKVENNCAVIDYDKCNGCGKCAEVCKRNCFSI